MEALDFGRTRAGEAVSRLVFETGSLKAAILTYGAALQDVRLDNVPYSLTAGSENLAEYEGALRYAGTIVGPVANRIGGASAAIEGRHHAFEANEGANTLHGGHIGTQGRVWRVVSHRADAATLALNLADGEGGFPGNRRIEARFALEAPAKLTLTLTAETDASTILNLANHSYWCLGAPGGGQTLRIDAESYLPVGPQKLPTGEVAPVGGTHFDLRESGPVGGRGYDHNFCLAPARRALAPAAWLSGGGVALEMATTEPGLQVYDGNPRGVALEAQGWPDAPNRPGFPSVLLRPGETYRQITSWSFSRPGY